jgi:hypothetical protein
MDVEEHDVTGRAHLRTVVWMLTLSLASRTSQSTASARSSMPAVCGSAIPGRAGASGGAAVWAFPVDDGRVVGIILLWNVRVGLRLGRAILPPGEVLSGKW